MNYCDLLNIRCSIKYYVVILLSLIIILFIIIGNKRITDVYKTVGYIKNNIVLINVPISESMISKLDNIKVEDNKYYLDDLAISDVLLDEINLINYQEIMIDLKDNINDNLLVPVTIYYNEEKVLTKIKNLLF